MPVHPQGVSRDGDCARIRLVSYFAWSDPPCALPALSTTSRRKPYWVCTSRSAISKAASMISCRVDGCSSPIDGSFSSTCVDELAHRLDRGPLSRLDRLERLL